MRTLTSPFLLFIFCTAFARAQVVDVSSFQHVVRWVSEANFPNYIAEEDAKDIVLSSLTKSLQQRNLTGSINLPSAVEYRYVSGFGKANNKTFKQDRSGAYKVGVLSFLTRATVGYAVLWRMEAIVQQNGKTVFENKIEHELEYFSPTGYMSLNPWMKKEDFVQLFSQLLHELFQTGDTLSQKIIIGSAEQKAAEVRKLIPQSKQCLLKTSGSFFQGSNFIVSLEQEDQTPDTVIYRDGWEQSATKFGLSEQSAKLLHNITGLNVAYQLKSKEKRFGRLEFAGGKKVKLRMEWMEATEKTTDGRVWSVSQTSPMVVEVYNDAELAANYVYTVKPIDSSVAFIKSSSGFAAHQLQGSANGIPVSVVYDPGNDLLFLSYDQQLKLVLVLQNINPENKSFSGYTLSKNKTTIAGGWKVPGKPKFKGSAEWYPLFYDASLNSQQVSQLTEPLLVLFFGIGNAMEYGNANAD